MGIHLRTRLSLSLSDERKAKSKVKVTQSLTNRTWRNSRGTECKQASDTTHTAARLPSDLPTDQSLSSQFLVNNLY